MKRLIIDRFEGKYAICEDYEQKIFAIDIKELPKDALQGYVLEISDDGELSVNTVETEKRRELIKNKQRRAFGK